MSRLTRTSSTSLLGRLFSAGTTTGLTDAELAARFLKTREPEAFAALVARHGPMVMAVCRGYLGSQGDAEDAFQATFLILLKRLGTFPIGQSLGGWLYRVARRVARQARLSENRARNREARVPTRSVGSVERDIERAEICEWVRREVDNLPERYRAPIVLCDLQGLTRSEASRLLIWPEGTVAVRISRGRRLLRDRLERRGIDSALASPLMIDPIAWKSSLDAAIKASSTHGAGNLATPSAIALAARCTAFVGGGTLKAAIALAVASCFTVGLIAAGNAPASPQSPSQAPIVSSPPKEKPSHFVDPNDPKFAGHFEGQVIGPDDKPLQGARIFIVPSDAPLTSTGPLRAASEADGRFAFDAPDMTFTALDGLPSRRQGRLIAFAEGYAPDSIVTWGETSSSFRSHSDPAKGAELVLRPVRDDVSIQGRVLDNEGKPLVGAEVRVLGLETPSHQTFDAYVDMYKRSKNEVWMFDFRSIQIGPEAAKPARTDAEGRFAIKGLGNDRVATLQVAAPGMVDMPLRVMTRDTADIILYQDSEGFPERANLGAKFTIKLKRGRSVSGVVRDRQTREPIAGMWVGVNVLQSLESGDGVRPVLTDAKGQFTLTGIHPGIFPKSNIQAVSQPGMPYLMAEESIDQQPLVIDCVKGLPFRIKLVDESGKRLDAKVEYQPIIPNPYAEAYVRNLRLVARHSLGAAAKRETGVYEGVVLPGPGAILLKAAGPRRYRPACVDPKAFFAPGKTGWTAQEVVGSYGTKNTIDMYQGWADQHDYDAIVLVNPVPGLKPLEHVANVDEFNKLLTAIALRTSTLMNLTVTLVEDKPRMLTILDPDGKPLTGVETQGLTFQPWDAEPRLRASTIPLTKLHPDRERRIKFVKEDRGWIGFLLAKADAETPYTVRLQPWATITGRVVNTDGGPIVSGGAQLGLRLRLRLKGSENPLFDDARELKTDDKGAFRVDRLIPGIPYDLMVHRHQFSVDAERDIDPFQPGEVRDLGEVRLKEREAKP